MADGFFSRQAGQDRRAWLDSKADGLMQFVPPELRKWFDIADMVNPVSEIGRAGQASDRMFAPETDGWGRVEAAGDMLSSMAGVAAPAAVAKAGGMTAAQALQEAMLSASAGPRAAGGMFAADEAGGLALPGFRSQADEIADMLASGRAVDVTDDMMAQADPQELWRLYESGKTGQAMPMDEASRMARAREMGFDTRTPLYRGDRDLQSYGRGAPGAREGIGVSVSDSPEVASTYVPEGGGLSSLFGRSSKPVEIDGQGNSWRMIEPDTSVTTPTNGKTRPLDEILEPEQYLSDEALQDYQAGLPYARYTTNELSRAMQGKGADRVTFDGIKDFGGSGRYMTDRAKDPSRVSMFADPSQLRSRFARFDPRLKHLANLSAGVGGVAMLSPQEQQKAEIRAYLEGLK